ncbi:MAG: phosphoglycerate dehydrogenase [Planctomycetaceae bacterium]|nr:phosphoglycerate dehydrogenase [Planctomycetaceae bacterium]
MIRVLCTALSVETGAHFKLLRDAGFECNVVDRSLNLWDETVLSNALQGYQAVLAGSEPFTPAVLAANPQIRVLSRYGVGFDAINLEACDAQGIVVATTPGQNHHSVAEHAVAMMMAVGRGFPAYDMQVRRGQWNRVARPRIMGSTLGLLGLGRIGQAVATRALGLGMNVVAYDPFPPQAFLTEYRVQMVPLEHIWEKSDVISLHMPAGPDTRHIVNRTSLSRMKDGAVLINTSRGPLVDESALIDALKSGKLRGAGLDVFEVEPLPVSSPLLMMENVLLSGHIAGLDNESHDDTCAMAAQTIITLSQGGWPEGCIQNLKGVTDWKW